MRIFKHSNYEPSNKRKKDLFVKDEINEKTKSILFDENGQPKIILAKKIFLGIIFIMMLGVSNIGYNLFIRSSGDGKEQSSVIYDKDTTKVEYIPTRQDTIEAIKFILREQRMKELDSLHLFARDSLDCKCPKIPKGL